MPNLTIIFKPTYLCNLRCRYCYAENLRDVPTATMNYEEAQAAFKWILKYCHFSKKKRVNIIWHGGEPLLTGPTFMSQTITFYKQLFTQNNIECQSSIQTNLLLLNDDFIPLITEHFDSTASISFDYQTGARIYPDGRDAASDIIEKVEYAQNKGIHLCGITLLTNQNVNAVKDIYHFFKNYGISFKLNRVFPPGTPSDSALNCAVSVSNDQYIHAMRVLFDEWISDAKAKTSVVNLHEIVVAYLTGHGMVCHMTGHCSNNFLSVCPGGTVLPCGTFDSYDYTLGNYYDNSPEEIHKKHQQIFSRGVSLSELHCDQCDIFRACNGGCPHSRITGWQKEVCVTLKAIWNHIGNRLREFGLTQYCLEHCSPDLIKDIIGKSYKTKTN